MKKVLVSIIAVLIILAAGCGVAKKVKPQGEPPIGMIKPMGEPPIG